MSAKWLYKVVQLEEEGLELDPELGKLVRVYKLTVEDIDGVRVTIRYNHLESDDVVKARIKDSLDKAKAKMEGGVV